MEVIAEAYVLKRPPAERNQARYDELMRGLERLIEAEPQAKVVFDLYKDGKWTLDETLLMLIHQQMGVIQRLRGKLISTRPPVGWREKMAVAWKVLRA